MFDHPYVCALSGVSATDQEIDESEGEIPESWVKITVERRFLNPQWIAIQNVKYGLLQQYLEPLTEEEREQNIIALSIQVDAQYHSLEQSVGKYVTEEEEVFVAPPESDTALFAEYNRLRDMLGLEEEEIVREFPRQVSLGGGDSDGRSDDSGEQVADPIPFTKKEATNAKED